jgi:hypothetical protein
MTETATDSSSSTSIWSTVVSVAMLILAIKFPILFLINGLFSLGIGIYFLIQSYTEMNKLRERDPNVDLGSVFWGLENFFGWVLVITGVVSVIIFGVLQYMNRGKKNSNTNNNRSNYRSNNRNNNKNT